MAVGAKHHPNYYPLKRLRGISDVIRQKDLPMPHIKKYVNNVPIIVFFNGATLRYDLQAKSFLMGYPERYPGADLDRSLRKPYHFRGKATVVVEAIADFFKTKAAAEYDRSFVLSRDQHSAK